MTAADHQEAMDVMLINARAARDMQELARIATDPFQRRLLERQAEGYIALVFRALPPELAGVLFAGEPL